MVTENYTEMRWGLAKKIGLGRKPGEKVAAKSPAKVKLVMKARSLRSAKTLPAEPTT